MRSKLQAAAVNDMCKFTIGQLVYFRSAIHNRDRTPQAFCVVSRLIEQSSGGIQIVYLLGNYGALVHECELCADMPPYLFASQARADELLDIDRQKSEAGSQYHWAATTVKKSNPKEQ